MDKIRIGVVVVPRIGTLGNAIIHKLEEYRAKGFFINFQNRTATNGNLVYIFFGEQDNWQGYRFHDVIGTDNPEILMRIYVGD